MIQIDFGSLVKAGDKPGEYRVTTGCPICGSNKFYINTNKKKFICFSASCGIAGNYKDESDDLPQTPVSLEILKNKAKSLFTKPQENAILDLNIFSDPVSEKFYPIAYSYLIFRKFTDSDLVKFRIRAGKEYYDKEKDKVISTWRGRVIFPFFENGKPVFAIGRTYTGNKYKYINTEGSKSVILYNFDNVKDQCIITEGLISAIAAERYSGVPAIPLLGTSMSSYQEYLIRSKCKRIFISLDGGVPIDKIATKFIWSSNIEVYFVNMPEGKDPDDLGNAYTEYFEKAVKINFFGG